MSAETAREVLAEVDRHRRLANAADIAMCKIRLGEQPVTTAPETRRVWFRPQHDGDCITQFDPAETSALYEALAEVRSKHEREAKRLEETLTVRKDGPR